MSGGEYHQISVVRGGHGEVAAADGDVIHAPSMYCERGAGGQFQRGKIALSSGQPVADCIQCLVQARCLDAFRGAQKAVA